MLKQATRYFVILETHIHIFNADDLAHRIVPGSGLRISGSTSPATMAFLCHEDETDLRIYWNPGVHFEGHSVYAFVFEEGKFKKEVEAAVQKLIDAKFLFEFKLVPVPTV